MSTFLEATKNGVFLFKMIQSSSINRQCIWKMAHYSGGRKSAMHLQDCTLFKLERIGYALANKGLPKQFQRTPDWSRNTWNTFLYQVSSRGANYKSRRWCLGILPKNGTGQNCQCQIKRKIDLQMRFRIKMGSMLEMTPHYGVSQCQAAVIASGSCMSGMMPWYHSSTKLLPSPLAAACRICSLTDHSSPKLSPQQFWKVSPIYHRASIGN